MKRPPINLPALFAQMGDWKYYSTVMRLGDAAERIDFAKEIAEIRAGKQLSDLIQRALTGARASEIGNYLVTNKDRFFNSLVVAVYDGEPSWLEFNVNPTQSNPLDGEIPEWAANAFGFLHLTGDEVMFAVDGQHRLAGMINAIARKPEVADDRISVLVVAHKSTDAGRRRSRKLFTTLNRSAVQVGKSEIIALDESDAAAIVTRRLVEEHPFFSNGQVLAQYGTANLSKTDSEHFVTIIKLYDLVGYVLGHIVNRLKREQILRLKFVRPTEAELEKHYADVSAFFETLIKAIPELKEYFTARGDKAKAIIKRERHDEKNVLFRSVGLEIFSRVTNYIQEDEGGWKEAIKALAKLPRHFTDTPYREVIYDITGDRIIPGRIRLVTFLLEHMLDYETPLGKDELRARYAKALQKEVADTRLPRRVAQ
ncbi:MAG: DGQHR domain-containing protein [Sphingomonas fennica]